MSTIDKYILLITQFVSFEITPSEFEVSYLKMFKNESEMLPEKTYAVLNELFHDVDAYCSDPSLRDEDDLDEHELLKRAEEALTRLI